MKYKITLKGKVYEVEVENGEAMLVSEYEAAAPAAPAPAAAPAAPAAQATAPAAPAAPVAPTGGTPVTAPLPGNILKIQVSVGQTVKAGDVLVIIEAMKMENEVVAASAGTIKQIVATTGSIVSAGDTLLVMG